MHGVCIFSLNLIKNCIDFFGKILKSASTLGDFRRIGCSHITVYDSYYDKKIYLILY
jgi:hypothetical protein